MSKLYEDPWKMFWITAMALILMITLVILSSCGSSRKTTKNDIKHNISTVEEKNNVITSTSMTGLSQIIQKHQVGKMTFVVYDTDKPPDTNTGKPPILIEGNAEISSDTNTHNKFEKSDSLGIVSTSQKSIEDHKTDNSVTEKISKESTLPKQIGFMLLGISLLIITCLISWLIYKKKLAK